MKLTTEAAAMPPAPLRALPVISATRLKAIGGDKEDPGCERKYAAQYPRGLKQFPTSALDTGSALHKLGEVFQITGDVELPESELGDIFRAGAHLLAPGEPWGRLDIEYEHRGLLPCGTPYVAYLDGAARTDDAVLIQDIKTTSNPRYAHSADSLTRDLQAMFYAWILLCDDGHWYAPRLGDGEYGPQQWKQWSTDGLQCAYLRWVYFLTRGNPRGWIPVDDDKELPRVSTELVAMHYRVHIAPLVEKIIALHQWHDANPDAKLSEIDRNLQACSGRGRWCGLGERNACEFGAIGTPILTLLTQGPRKMTTSQDRLAALKARRAQTAVTSDPKVEPAAAAAPEEAVASTTPSASAPTEQEPVAAAPETSAPESSSVSSAPSAVSEPKRGRGRPKATVGINPPEVLQYTDEQGGKHSSPAAAVKMTADGAPSPADVATAGTEFFDAVTHLRSLLPTGTTVTITAVAS
jgi:hypothetical protein